MIKLFWIILLINLTARAQMLQNDKLLHMGGSYVISSTIAALVYDKTKNKKCSLLSGFAVSMFIGAGKEIYDRKHGNPDWNDMLANTVGATLGIVTIRIAI
tara:strand:+ start:1556 stop:1858 length:303 start_codon:yes stop_codon:yes gene_type:complete